MIDASADYNALDQVSPFLQSITDVKCGYENKPEVTKRFTSYFHLLGSSRRDHEASEWFGDIFYNPHQRIRDFKTPGKRGFGKYQPSGMET